MANWFSKSVLLGSNDTQKIVERRSKIPLVKPVFFLTEEQEPLMDELFGDSYGSPLTYPEWIMKSRIH